MFGFSLAFETPPFCLSPALQLYFAGANTLDPRVTFTRASSGTHFDSTGRLVTDGNNVARFDYDPVTLLPRGLLIEEQRTNLLLHSRDMTQAAWSKTDVTAARTQVGIDGVASSACLMTEGSAGNAATAQLGSAVTAGSTLTGSMVAKKSGHGFVMVFTSEITAVDGAYAIFDLTNGLVSSTTNVGAGTASSASITNLGGGWYRCSVTCLPNGTYTVPRLQVRSATSLASNTRVPNATYIVDCAQLEVGAFATSPIITGAATATRAADSASMTGTNFSSWYNQSAGTFVVDFDTSVPLTSGCRAIQVSPGSGDNQISLFKDSLGRIVPLVVVSTVNQGTAPTTNTVEQGVPVKAAICYANNDTAASLNAGVVATDATNSLPTVNKLQIGSDNAVSSFVNGHIRSIRYYNTRLPNSSLVSLTA